MSSSPPGLFEATVMLKVFFCGSRVAVKNLTTGGWLSGVRTDLRGGRRRVVVKHAAELHGVTPDATTGDVSNFHHKLQRTMHKTNSDPKGLQDGRDRGLFVAHCILGHEVNIVFGAPAESRGVHGCAHVDVDCEEDPPRIRAGTLGRVTRVT